MVSTALGPAVGREGRPLTGAVRAKPYPAAVDPDVPPAAAVSGGQRTPRPPGLYGSGVPPVALTISPVMYEERSEARNT